MELNDATEEFAGRSLFCSQQLLKRFLTVFSPGIAFLVFLFNLILFRLILAAMARANQKAAKRGSPCQGQRQRSEKRDSEGQRQRTKESSINSSDRNERHKNNHGSDRRTNQRHGDFAERTAYGLDTSLSRVAVQHDVFDHDNRIIND